MKRKTKKNLYELLDQKEAKLATKKQEISLLQAENKDLREWNSGLESKARKLEERAAALEKQIKALTDKAAEDAGTIYQLRTVGRERSAAMLGKLGDAAVALRDARDDTEELADAFLPKKAPARKASAAQNAETKPQKAARKVRVVEAGEPETQKKGAEQPDAEAAAGRTLHNALTLEAALREVAKRMDEAAREASEQWIGSAAEPCPDT